MTVLVKSLRSVRGNFAPLRYPNFRLYLGGQTISLIGTWLQVTAQSWVVWRLSGSEAALGTVSMLNALPLLLLGIYAGVWADRVDRRKLLIGTQIAAMLLAFVLAVLTESGLVQLWHVYVLSFLLGIANALDMPAQQAFLGDLSGQAEVRKAVNLNVTIFQVSRILGPALAGMVVARLGEAPAFWLNGLSFLAVIATLIMVRATRQARPRTDVNPLRQIGEAITYVRAKPRIQDLFLFAILLTFFVFSILMNILPAVADKLLGGNAETLGLILASSGVGALLSVLIIVPIMQSLKRPGPFMIGAMFWMAGWLSVFAHSHSLLLSLLAMCMGSIGAPAVMTMAMGLVQFMSPPEMRGRLISLFTTISFGMSPLAALWIGQTAERLGVDTSIQLNAILLAIGGLGMLLLRPAILTYDYSSGAATSAPTVEPIEDQLSKKPELVPATKPVS